ncbi:RNA repair domain-containing protein [Methanococcus aeolicus]|uniref:MJ1316 RNA cyclic group end recognition domain-containing protein n=1 Tax=Methanococcus aeolicus (strain ATCC BAA-1280 / DSM 17508 / OCM 812 / Nankai-3) TaxID=419665 RepID=A6UVF8_META3|nr:RNA repair domain-containing protein [Methanococcus aeolicus]ABR56480.1 Protein of unknown function DUF504 [Methanococcus aeolicus Nankai-3]UXM85568.1 RNA repair domain-containing protein [Methanococcus aeolicus]
MLKELINKILWHPDYDAKDYEITYLHRAGDKEKGDKSISLTKSISMENMLINDSFIIYEEGPITRHIPFHRILKIRNKKTKEILYEKTIK